MVLCHFERVIFQADTGFCILAYTTEDDSVPQAARKHSHYRDGKIHFTAVGYSLPASDATDVTLEGKWEPSKYGLQFHVDRYERVLPQSTDGITAYLSSGFVKGIGPSLAKKIVARFGTDTLKVMENNPRQLLSVSGIAEGKLQEIIQSYTASREYRQLSEFLSPFEVSKRKIEKIYEEFGSGSLDTVQKDPFQLCRVKGFGFLTVDAIARKTKVSLRNPLRYSGALHYCLEEAQKSGHLFLPYSELISKCYELLNKGSDEELVPKTDVATALASEHDRHTLYNENGRVYLLENRFCEIKAAKRIVSMLLDEDLPPIRNLAAEIKCSEAALQQNLAKSQYHAVEVCLTHTCSIVTGGPGVGKTTTLRVILDVYHRVFPRNVILLAAPTGRASRRMYEQTGFPAATLHSAMGIVKESDLLAPMPEFLDADLVVIDEASMVDMHLAYALLDRLKPGAQLIMVGDPDQLPSVGAGNVLREMIRCGLVPVAVLDTVFRQARNSRIALNAQAVNNNNTGLLFGNDFSMLEVQNGEEAAQLVLKTFLAELTHHDLMDVQILSPLRKKGAVCADNLNRQIRELVNPPCKQTREVKCAGKIYREGDRIIQTKNGDSVSNGDVGVIEHISYDENDEPQIEIRFLDGRIVEYTSEMLENVDLSYCITIHKSQGGEFPVVIIPLLKEHYIMLKRNLLYTAISRAKTKVIIIGQRQAVYMAIHRNDVDQRNTVLADRISAYYGRETHKRVG